ncbi:MAG: hypothetical protein LBD90_02230 [Bifidobacteriaceae bacterium]|nr:hypothetical protein [Bifidobacteriaceae bacterium]
MELAKKYGVTTDYINWKGQPTAVPAETVKAILTALGARVETPEDIAAESRGFDDRGWRRPLAPSTVVRAGAEVWVPVTLPRGAKAELWIDLEADPLLVSGGGRVDVAAFTADDGDHRDVDGRGLTRRHLELPRDLPLGWHHLRVR